MQMDYKVHETIGLSSPLLSDEAELFDKKWFDYRFMHPLEATFNFALAYTKVYPRYGALRHGTVDAEKRLTVKSYNGICDPCAQSEKVLSALWKARKAADELGIPYEIYCCYALDYSERSGWKEVASVKDLSRKDVKKVVDEKWVQRNRDWIEKPKLDIYHQEGDHSYQLAWREQHRELLRLKASSDQ
tara:strand:- start:5851 stop:6414 length:564 start_codon:yes stop_codon:yes gene_type:complete